MSNSLSVVISVFNGEKWLENCLSSVTSIADEIIIVDHGSTDNTFSIARKFTKHIFQRKNDETGIDKQKNFGFEKATGDWIFSIDADEEVTPELGKEIKNITKKDFEYEGFFVSRKNIIFGKWIQHTGWSPDYQLRLFKKGKGKYISEHVHENLSIQGDVGTLEHSLIHHHYETMRQFLYRSVLVYAPNEAEYLWREKGYTFSYADSVRFPFQEFLSRFFAREGYKDGFTGLMLSFLMACYHFAIFAYLWEKYRYQDTKEYVAELRAQCVSIPKEFSHWTKRARFENEKNPVKKILKKIKKKFFL